jgi:predicted permease
MSLRQCLRRLRQQPFFSLLAVLTLALGLGANVAIFSVVNGALLHPLSYPAPGRLITLNVSIPQFAAKYPYFPVNAASYYAWGQRSRTLSQLALASPESWVLTAPGETPVEIHGAGVTASMFSTLGVKPELGSDFTPAQDQPGKNNVVILTDAFWRAQFHADPGVIGRTADLNGSPVVIVGVMPPSLHFPDPSVVEGAFFGNNREGVSLFRPLGLNYAHAADQNAVGEYNFLCIARMRPGVTRAQVRAELDVISAALIAGAKLPPDLGHIRVITVAHSLQQQIVGPHALGLWLLLGAVLAVLVIVCLNLANLLLVRVHGRGQELAVRIALGAGPRRLLGETVTEGVVLALLGGALGIAAAAAALRLLVHAAPSGIPRIHEVALTAPVLIFGLVLSLLCGVLFSGWPAWRASRTDPQRALRAGGRGASDSARRLRSRSWLVAAQAALAALLLLVAGLLVASYFRLITIPAGFSPRSVTVARLDWRGKAADRVTFYRQVLDKARAAPGVRDAGLIDVLPTRGANDNDLISHIHDTRPMVERPLCSYDSVSAGYFAAMGIPLLRGRAFTADDMIKAERAMHAPKGAAPAPIPAVISQATAQIMWPGRNPIGRQFTRTEPGEAPFQVIGVVADVRAFGLDRPVGLAAYLPYTYTEPSEASLILRSPQPPSRLAGEIRRLVWSVRPDSAIPSITSMDAVVNGSVAARRFQLALVLLFSFCALLLAALGIYGTVAYSVEMRSAEMALRLTLGASRGDVLRLIVRQGLVPVVVGLAAGAAAALAAGHWIAALLFGVPAADPTVFALVALVLLLTAAAACAVPAFHASRTDPAHLLRA